MADLLQILKRTGVKATATFYAGGVPTDSATQVKVDVVRPDGTLLVTQANAADEAGDGVYGYQLAPQDEPTLLRLDWSGTIGGVAMTVSTWVEVVGAHLFGIAELRAFKVGDDAPFASAATWPDSKLMEARAATLDEFEDILGFSPVPRFRRETFDGDGDHCLGLPGLKAHRVLAVTVNGVTQTATDYQVGTGNQLEAISNYGYGTRFTWGRRNVAVEWVHGWQRVEGLGRDAAMVMAAKVLQPSGFSNATSVTTPDGMTYSYTPSEVGRGGYRRFTGIRDLDEWLNRRSSAAPVVA